MRQTAGKKQDLLELDFNCQLVFGGFRIITYSKYYTLLFSDYLRRAVKTSNSITKELDINHTLAKQESWVASAKTISKYRKQRPSLSCC